jgi:thiosulfate dehydrogenase (quinone) large subunit
MTTLESVEGATMSTHVPEYTATPHTITPTAGKLIGATRIALGLVFAWSFLDKLLGLGYSTPSERAWINGGSPTKGFLGAVNRGPLQDMFNGWSGQAWADWLFMLGLAGLGVALLTGAGMRIAAVAGTLMMALMWLAEWPPAKTTAAGEPTGSTNPLIDYHVIYALVMITLAALHAGQYWGLGNRWSRFDLVGRNRWLI